MLFQKFVQVPFFKMMGISAPHGRKIKSSGRAAVLHGCTFKSGGLVAAQRRRKILVRSAIMRPSFVSKVSFSSIKQYVNNQPLRYHFNCPIEQKYVAHEVLCSWKYLIWFSNFIYVFMANYFTFSVALPQRGLELWITILPMYYGLCWFHFASTLGHYIYESGS